MLSARLAPTEPYRSPDSARLAPGARNLKCRAWKLARLSQRLYINGERFDAGAIRFARRRQQEVKSQVAVDRSEEHTSELQSPDHLVCRLLLEKKKKQNANREMRWRRD